MAQAGFELLINFVGPKIMESDTTFRAAIPVHQIGWQ
jgi:hypothetical protein